MIYDQWIIYWLTLNGNITTTKLDKSIQFDLQSSLPTDASWKDIRHGRCHLFLFLLLWNAVVTLPSLLSSLSDLGLQVKRHFLRPFSRPSLTFKFRPARFSIFLVNLTHVLHRRGRAGKLGETYNVSLAEDTEVLNKLRRSKCRVWTRVSLRFWTSGPPFF